jgi:hypothetical protein
MAVAATKFVHFRRHEVKMTPFVVATTSYRGGYKENFYWGSYDG